MADRHDEFSRQHIDGCPKCQHKIATQRWTATPQWPGHVPSGPWEWSVDAHRPGDPRHVRCALRKVTLESEKEVLRYVRDTMAGGKYDEVELRHINSGTTLVFRRNLDGTVDSRCTEGNPAAGVRREPAAERGAGPGPFPAAPQQQRSVGGQRYVGGRTEAGDIAALHMAVKTLAGHANADVDDSGAAQSRAASQRERHVQGVVDAAILLRLPPEDLTVIKALLDLFTVKADAVGAAKSATIAAADGARAAVAVTTKHAGMIGAAAGEPYRSG